MALATQLEVFRGRQIFIDDISRQGKTRLDSAYSPLFLLPSKESEINTDGVPSFLNLPDENVTINVNWTDNSTSTFWPFSIDMQHLGFVAMCLCFVTLVLFIIVALKLRHICLRWRRRRSGPRIAIIEAEAGTVPTPQCYHNSRRGLLSRMLARIEEFDSLTPLIVTPNSLSDDDHAPLPVVAGRHPSADRLSNTTNTLSNTPVSFRGSPRRRPRGINGKITLFPLASNARKAEIYAPPEVASDSGDSIRMPLVNSTYTRVPSAAVANGSVPMRNPFEDLDLVSIDRTSGASTLDRRPTPNDLLAPVANAVQQDSTTAAVLALANKSSDQYLEQRDQFQQQSAAAASSAGDVYPLSTLPSPASTDILIPVSELHSSAPNLHRPNSAPGNNNKHHRATNGNNHYRFVIKRESTSVDSLNSNLSSPIDSSVCGDTGSPLDTTGSLAELSDSVYMASESENSEVIKNGSGRVYTLDTGSSQRWYTVSAAGSAGESSDRSEPDISTFEYEPPGGKRYFLHRIEEESVDDVVAAAVTATSSSTPGDKEQSKRSIGNKIREANNKKSDNGNNRKSGPKQ